MGKSFVYNAGSAEDCKKEDELWFDFGVFIDGTLNNKENTRLRRVYREEDENSTITKWKKKVDKEKERIDYEAVQRGNPVTPPVGEDVQEYKDYLKGIYRTERDEAGTDNSYSNDDTNITRMWNCCTKDYRIYVEGMGTADKEYDYLDGFAFGSGRTGIRARVRLACERIADRILKIKNDEDEQKKLTQITLDVFGFSRGAASARNFVHEINVKKTYKPQEIEIPDGYENTYDSHGNPRTKQKYRKALGDADGLEIDPKLLIDGKMPRFGHLGYSLLRSKVVTPEELENILVMVRFVGVYDTVSSYYEMGALGAYDPEGKLVDDPMLRKVAKEAWSTHFTNNEEELGLQKLGESTRFQKLVHFTAQDEHRRNFSLTRVAGANQPDAYGTVAITEKNLPGVHCDIGGAYENEVEEYIDEIGTNLSDDRYVRTGLMQSIVSPNTVLTIVPSLIAANNMPATGLEALKRDLIDQHWYKEKELEIVREKEGHKWIAMERYKIPAYWKLSGTRTRIRKEYSYIPLHFMEEFCRQTSMNNFMMDSTETKYPLSRDPFLEKVKKSLHQYVFDDAPEWEFISDAELQNEELERYEAAKEMMRNKELNSESDIALPGIDIKDTEEEIRHIQLEEIKIYNLNKQAALRKLRHEYLHWSSNRDWFGMEPNDDRKRVYYPKT